MGELQLRDVYKNYGQMEVIKGVDLDVDHGEFIVFVGPSGCGKSTLLRMIAGLEEITGGDITIDSKIVNNLPPVKRGIAMVFQSYALYPHMSVYENIAFPLRVERLSNDKVEEKVNAAAGILQLTERLKHKPGELSGGQRQRVAIGRAIVREPSVFLFDEPLSNLDAALRAEMRVELAKLHNNLDATMIYVTHDQVEAMTMADRIVVLDHGIISQVGTPLELYHKPQNLFVAGFIGNPKMNFITVTGKQADETGIVVTLPSGQDLDVKVLPRDDIAGRSFTLGIRPEDLTLKQADATIEITPSVVEHLGIHTVTYSSVEGASNTFCALLPGSAPAKVGASISMGLNGADCHLFDENGLAFDRRLAVSALDPAEMHL
ncbi:ABC transporter ATP-binding protein [Roseibium album]|uniref:Maltose/maltodextrin import ATP-binding protein MalK n=1 Tax=Roseibium album TaxID=311410 RepID=A0A0M7B216_9HYPH|nr:sn-glycerol-3-phosphate ABC transporter ATP-binding protein UgpC [Roseibium album]MBG6159760.1 multiple sugar transport system ATP-binding protein [Labrenzia sp. EL_162]MBG6165650.1 multiple sugar transport system ATP-binding protein [Labrenzia sp. EL_195]MBG6198292.1 multiple sugar transport system ATP-binding protein [Labrenzia sp. EL_159]MBG6201911.1 multiple sugar transport system ATP-binding protein [Labrenzia sp. EL_13]CTQ63261.1 Maltose/maltodextrin import ATP-binding protein MalK [R